MIRSLSQIRKNTCKLDIVHIGLFALMALAFRAL
jgi:hypothetical protein